MEKAEAWGRWEGTLLSANPQREHMYHTLVMFSHSLIQSVAICLVIRMKMYELARQPSLPQEPMKEHVCISSQTREPPDRALRKSSLKFSHGHVFAQSSFCSNTALCPHPPPPPLALFILRPQHHCGGPSQALRPHKALLDSFSFCSYQPDGICRPPSPPKIPTGLCLTLRFMALLTFDFGSWLRVSIFIS